MYKAIGRPRGMDVSDVPQFYLRSEGINVENLLQLCDKDSDRFTAGERVAMEDFLNRCHNLKTLELAVGSPYAFRWIASTLQAQSTPRPSSVQLMQRPMERLEKLSLWSNRGHTVLAYALSDAIAAFGKTLQELTCTDSSSYPVSYPYLDGADDFSELERLPSSMSVCVNWHLPRVRCIRISLGRAIQFGSFDECPLLEELSIFTTRQQLKTSDPYLNGDPLMDYQTLMPVWKLPRLRTLVLTGDIMVRFNYESLRSMKQLSDMAIHIQRSGSEFNFANIYSSLYSLPLQQAFESMKARIQTRNESAGDEDHVPVCCETSDFLPWNWKSDSLVKLSLHGPPVMALNLQLLEQLPSLREVSLAVPNNCQYTFSASETEAMARVFSMQRLGNLQVEPLDHLLQEQWKLFARPLKRSISDQYVKPSLSMFMRNSKRQGIAGLWDHSIQPFVQSRLQEFSISSPLVHDVPETLVQLLAWSAPNLKTLRLDSQSVFDAKAEETIVMLLKAIPTADKIIKFRATQETAKVRSQGSGGVLTTLDSSTQEGGSRKGQVPRQELGISDNTSKPKGHPVYSKSGLKSFLIKVLVHVGLSQKSLRELGLRLIKSHEVKIYQGQGVRLYRLQGRDYVEEGDLQIL
ncbi:hypothetical protein BGW38_008176 [Lunasporangiospora selenospora]|uniref:Uncharacterized protein n=1 Tax=Lunasporangiospora selenospora TaxID=979761 RepID=A0A9P6KFR0_9FUNG|nr:hypothetical protein BGW38_008176 [Lunasporangiospora selenospora]